jgi:molecular chaperone DnaK (HSP70)
VIIRRNLPIPVEDGKAYLHETHGGRNETLEIYLTQGESHRPLDCSVLGKYVFNGIQATDAEVTIDVKMSYDVNGVVQVRAHQRDTGHALKLKVEPVPDDLSWLGLPPSFEARETQPDPTRIYLLIDTSASMAGTPLVEAQQAARAFLDKCDFTRTEVGLISFSEEVTLQAEATDNVRKVQAALARLEPETTTNLSDALDLARQKLNRLDRTRYIVLLTDGYPDAAESAVEQAARARGEGIEIVAIGMGDADLGYLRRLASTEEGSIFANRGELVGAFGHIARIIAEGGRTLRKLS